MSSNGEENFTDGTRFNDGLISLGIARAGDILNAFLVGLEETKQPRIVQISIGCIYRLIENDAIDPVCHVCAVL